MSEGKKAAAGTVNVQRRTWDKSEYESKAKERAAREESGGIEEEEDARRAALSRPAPPGLKGPAGSQRAFLQTRDTTIDLESKLHKKRVRLARGQTAHINTAVIV